MKNELLILLTMALITSPQTPSDHHHDMEMRGNEGMRFDQGMTTHHFLLRKDGGAIQVTANTGTDTASIDHIRMHMGYIRIAFKSGDFNIPGFVHDQTPPGVPTMMKLKNQIQYRYEVIANGGRVMISSKNLEAVAAVHDLLKFQITEHKTGDALEIK
jgi:hypothetical protein